MKQKFGLHSLYRKALICLPDFISINTCGSWTIASTSTHVNTGSKPASGNTASSTSTGSIQVKWNTPVSNANGTDLILSEHECHNLSSSPTETYSVTTIIEVPSLTSSSNAGLLHGENFLPVTVQLVDGLESVNPNEIARTL